MDSVARDFTNWLASREAYEAARERLHLPPFVQADQSQIHEAVNCIGGCYRYRRIWTPGADDEWCLVARVGCYVHGQGLW